MSDEKTEHPTQKKLKDAREKGQIARSRDLATAAATLGAVMALGKLGGRLLTGLSERLASDLSHFGDHGLRPITNGDVTSLFIGGVGLVAVLVGPIALATGFASVFAQTVQGGWMWAPSALQLNWNALNPANGLKKLVPSKAGVDMLKTYVIVAVIVWAGWSTVQTIVQDSVRLAWMSPLAAASAGWDHAQAMLWKIAWTLAFLGLADYGLQKYRFTSGLKMTKQEIRDEGKSSEGSSEVKGRIRRVQRDMARRRMISDVQKATVVITNPTHFAVALQYKRGTMTAPLVLAKGADHLAAAIREQARKHGIPMVENKPLAQALFKTAEVGEGIPGDLFAAVAEVLAQLIRFKQLVL